MTGPRIGSLFAGYGGLEMGVASVLAGAPAWFSEIESAPSRILAHHWPTVPNHGDITTIDWDAVEPIDILTGGFPCQDVSHAGKRLGLKPGTRSGLWAHMAYAINKLRPRLVVAENVRGLLSAEAGGDLEPCPWCVGNGERGALRALGAVLGDLADLGYDTQWHGVRASDAGAPHGRFRVFIYAWPAADTPSGGREGSRSEHGWQPDTDGGGGGLQRPDDTARRAGIGSAATDTDGAARHQRRLTTPRQEESRWPRPDTRRRDRAPVVWGDYEPAIRRWERALGRAAPPPTEPGRNGAPRLSPTFVEWMMGLPHGHVTQVPGLTRNDQLKALGNGVVPQQAAHATRIWAATTQGTHPTATAQEGAALLPTPIAADAKGADANTGGNPTLGGAVLGYRPRTAARTGRNVRPLRQAAPVKPAEPTGTDGGLW